MNLKQLLEQYENHIPITMVTAYDYPSAKTVEESGIDMILVGDSVATTVLGLDSTIQVSMDDMIHHTKAVKRGAKDTFTVVDMPFSTVGVSVDDTVSNGMELYKQSNAQALKIEGAHPITLEAIERLTDFGVPIVGHIGLTPQSFGITGYAVQAKTEEAALNLIQEAKSLQESGIVMLVLEAIPSDLAKRVTGELNVPTIGIGAGSHTDGQVLVYHDILQYGIHRYPKFVKPYLNLNESIQTALSQFRSEVRDRTFPNEDTTYKVKVWEEK